MVLISCPSGNLACWGMEEQISSVGDPQRMRRKKSILQPPLFGAYSMGSSMGPALQRNLRAALCPTLSQQGDPLSLLPNQY